MSITQSGPQEPGDALSQPASGETLHAPGAIAWSSFFFALLQSICTFFVAVDGLRLLIGIGSFAISAWVGASLVRFHTDWIRIPMIVLALFGSLLNLAILWQIRRLRNRPASQWRQAPVPPSKLRKERVQLVLSIAALVLIAIEEYLHFHLHHTL